MKMNKSKSIEGALMHRAHRNSTIAHENVMRPCGALVEVLKWRCLRLVYFLDLEASLYFYGDGD